MRVTAAVMQANMTDIICENGQGSRNDIHRRFRVCRAARDVILSE